MRSKFSNKRRIHWVQEKTRDVWRTLWKSLNRRLAYLTSVLKQSYVSGHLCAWIFELSFMTSYISVILHVRSWTS
uniref:Uncharacterized protein n=1 Tax=Arion vulgaris TaxID=1028688 RepID=A0A0B6Z8X2_9EUPU